MSQRNIHVELLPTIGRPELLAGHTVVVIDVLRATSSIMMALTQGAECIIPCASLDSARVTHARLGSNSVMAGERGGRIVDGFHFGNSPPEFTFQRIGGKTIVLATTNGTVAMEQCRQTAKTLVGCFLNLDAVIRNIVAGERADVTMLCSGTNGQVTNEDVLCAGALVEKLLQADADSQLSEGAAGALENWQQSWATAKSTTPNSLSTFLEESLGGRNLLRIGHHEDVLFCSQLNLLDSVAQLDVDRWEIRMVV